jgi:hypothetical protein
MSVTTKMTIPNNILVGYQYRDDTYTDKLGFITYVDSKGKLRKENAWTGWQDLRIKSDEFVNEPTSGFVLNKDVGGVRGSYSSWNTRIEKVRVHDPRGFEIEIDVPNLLFILQECSSIKGKGLEGELVYAWNGQSLVLLPATSKEYQECLKFTDYQSKKITKEDMVEGCTYAMKDMSEVMYLGRYDFFEKTSRYDNSHKPSGKRYVFSPLIKKKYKHSWEGPKDEYVAEKDLKKVAARTSDKASPDFAKEFDNFKKSRYCNEVVEVKLTKMKITDKTLEGMGYEKKFFIKEDNKYYLVEIEKRNRGWGDKIYDFTKSKKEFKPVLKNGICSVPKIPYRYGRGERNTTQLGQGEILKKEFYDVKLVTKNGFELDILKI